MLQKLVCLALVLGFMAGCATSPPIAQGSSQKLASYNRQPKKLYISAQMNSTMIRKGYAFEADHDEADIFQAGLVDMLSKCGMKVQYRNLNPTALPEAELALTRQFAPDHVLDITAVWEEKTQGAVTSATYLASLTDQKDGRTVWKSELKLNKMNHEAGENLARTLLSEMASDHIIADQCVMTAD